MLNLTAWREKLQDPTFLDTSDIFISLAVIWIINSRQPTLSCYEGEISKLCQHSDHNDEDDEVWDGKIGTSFNNEKLLIFLSGGAVTWPS